MPQIVENEYNRTQRAVTSYKKVHNLYANAKLKCWSCLPLLYINVINKLVEILKEDKYVLSVRRILASELMLKKSGEFMNCKKRKKRKMQFMLAKPFF